MPPTGDGSAGSDVRRAVDGYFGDVYSAVFIRKKIYCLSRAAGGRAVFVGSENLLKICLIFQQKNSKQKVLNGNSIAFIENKAVENLYKIYLKYSKTKSLKILLKNFTRL